MNTGPGYKASVRLYVNAGVAKPSPKIGQALGPLGINMMQFCKEFNERTGAYKNDAPMRVLLSAYMDRSFKFVVKPPPTTWFLKKACGITKCSDMPNQNIVGRIGMKYIYEIAKAKQEVDPMLRAHDVEGICRMVLGTARSMGLQVVEDTLPPEPIKVDV